MSWGVCVYFWVKYNYEFQITNYKYRSHLVLYLITIIMKEINMAPLTPEEKRIIIDKGTEMPFTGKYWDYKEAGTYICRQCGAELYSSDDKFDSGCGWPSFDDAIPWAVKWVDDADGMRTEITCANCNGHLGHVFIGERMTDKNTRHCVNSLSMKFIPKKVEIPTYEKATFGGGCFRCIEAGVQRLKWVIQVQSWYSGGKREYPTYEHICTGCTGHIEVVQVTFDPAIISYETLLKVFFSLHSPTSVDRQGADAGEQYRSVIFYHDNTQRDIAEKLIAELNASWIYDKPIVTQVSKLEAFRVAEWYHQDYYNQHGTKPYCQIVIDPKIAKLRKEWSHLLKDDN
jgi:peptide methionine sulfoxide reductase msrA/msrB